MEIKMQNFLTCVLLSFSQVAVTAVAMMFDKDQTQEKPPNKSISKGLSVYQLVYLYVFTHCSNFSKYSFFFSFILFFKHNLCVQSVGGRHEPTITVNFIFLCATSIQGFIISSQAVVRMRSSCSFPWSCVPTRPPPTLSHRPKSQVAIYLFHWLHNLLLCPV